MEQGNVVTEEKRAALDLGYVVCKWCGEVVATLPTNGVKRIYGECPERKCRPAAQQAL